VLDFRWPAVALERRIRAFDPFPGATAVLGGTTIKFWRARSEAGAGAPGAVLSVDDTGIVVACGEGALRLLELQKPGGRRLAVVDFQCGTAIRPGDCFET
jgi:methionyl-tRNA formyltransferase